MGQQGFEILLGLGRVLKIPFGLEGRFGAG